MLTKDVDIPTFQTLTVQEANVSTATLMAASTYIGKQCEAVNNEFMLCRQELNDPRSCVELGKKVTACGIQMFRKIKHECLREFNQYAKCVDKSSGDYQFRHCRKTQAVFDKCMSDKLCMDRPDFGYYCRPRVHTSPYPPPPSPPCPCIPKVADETPSLPDCKPRYPPRFGSRFYHVTE